MCILDTCLHISSVHVFDGGMNLNAHKHMHATFARFHSPANCHQLHTPNNNTYTHNNKYTHRVSLVQLGLLDFRVPMVLWVTLGRKDQPARKDPKCYVHVVVSTSRVSLSLPLAYARIIQLSFSQVRRAERLQEAQTLYT